MAWEFEKAGDFGQIERNYYRGVVGQQPFPAFDSRAVVEENGNVTITYGSEIRGFVLMGDDYRPAGGNGTVAVEVQEDGTVVLTEADGGALTFRGSDGRLVQLDDPRTGRTTISMDDTDRATGITSPNGDETLYTYTSAGLIRTMTDPVGRVTVFEYDGSGQLQSASDAAGTIEYSYHSGAGAAREGALKSITYTDGTSRLFDYNDRGQLARATSRATDGSAIETNYSYSDQSVVTITDQLGNETQFYRAPGGTVACTIDDLGLLSIAGVTKDATTISLTDLLVDPIGYQSGESNHYRFVRNNPITSSDPSGLIEIFGYTPAQIEAAIPAPVQAVLGPAGLKTGFTKAAQGIGRIPLTEVFKGGGRLAASQGVTQGGRFVASRVALPLYLAGVGGFHTGRAIDKTTDYYFPDAKNAFRNTLAHSSLQPGPRPDSPIYENGGVNDTAYNESQRKNMEDPIVMGVTKSLINSGAYTPEEALLKARQLVNNCRRAGDCDPPRIKKSQIVRPRDPNDIVGPAGAA